MANANKSNVTKRGSLNRPLTVSEGDQNFQELINVIEDSNTLRVDVNKRTIFVDTVAELQSWPSPISGQQALVSGVPFIYTGNTWTPSGNFVTPEIYGALGDNIADDTTAWVDALNAGANVFGKVGATYKVTAPLIVENSKVDLRGSTLRFVLEGEVVAFDVRDDASVYGGTVSVEGTPPAGGWVEGSGAYQAPILVGDYDTGVGRTNVTISDLTILSNRDNGNGIVITGDSNNIIVKNINFPDSPNLGRAIMTHWGGFNYGGTVTTTTHPHDITIENIQCGSLTNSGVNTAVIFMSASYNISIKNVYAKQCDTAIFNFAGDWGSSKADKNARWICCNISVENVSVPWCKSYGLRVVGKPFLGGSQIATEMLVQNMIVNGGSDLGTDGIAGVFLEACSGVLVERSRFSVFDNAVKAGASSYRNTFRDCEFSNIRFSGAMVDEATNPPEDWWFDGCKSFDFNTNLQTSGTNRAGIYIGASVRTRVTNCILGLVSGENGKYGIRCTSSTEKAILEGNHVKGLETSGDTPSAYSLGTIVLGSGNTAADGLLLHGSLSTVSPIGRGFQWVDSTGDLRISSTFPTSDTDGVVVGTQT